MKKAVKNETTFFNEFAEFAETISDEEWAFYDMADDISEQIYQFMDQHDISRAELANRMNSSRAFITKVLRGDANMTFKTFTKLLCQLGARAEVKVVREADNIQWMGLISKNRSKAYDRIPQNFNKVETSSAGCTIGKNEMQAA